MPELVEWLPDGTPRSPRFGDIYRSSTGGFEQARLVFLRGCGLPQAWAGQPQWRILETGFGLGLNFLASWHAWKGDPQRCGLLHFASVEAWPVAAGDLLRAASADAELTPLAGALAAQWFGLTPGVHRLVFEEGRVLLTLYIGDVRDALREQPFDADSVFLDGFDPGKNAAMWEPRTLKAVARRCRRGTTLATWTAAGDVRRTLGQCGFSVHKVEGLPPKRHCLQGVFDPAWEPRRRQPVASARAGRCVVVGAGLAGASAAASLARRGWTVTVLDAADRPAQGASGLPVGMLAPHFSPDDNLLSRLSRAGVRATLQQARALLPEGEDWRETGVLEVRAGDAPGLREFPAAMLPWTRTATAAQVEAAALAEGTPALWHEQAAWIKPTALVRAWLAQPGVTWRGHTRVDRIEPGADGWVLLDAQGAELATADLVIVAAALASGSLTSVPLPLQPVRGQVSWAAEPLPRALPPFPVNGDGHFLPNVATPNGPAWFSGSTFDRGQTERDPRDEDHASNLRRLERLLPAIAGELAPVFVRGAVHAWTGIRCASADRRPLLGEAEPGLWVSTALGSRGMTFCALCAELVAAQVHGEPLPLDTRLARALDARRALKARAKAVQIR